MKCIAVSFKSLIDLWYYPSTPILARAALTSWSMIRNGELSSFKMGQKETYWSTPTALARLENITGGALSRTTSLSISALLRQSETYRTQVRSQYFHFYAKVANTWLVLSLNPELYERTFQIVFKPNQYQIEAFTSSGVRFTCFVVSEGNWYTDVLCFGLSGGIWWRYLVEVFDI